MERRKKFFRKKRSIAGSICSWLLILAMVISNVSTAPELLLTVQAAESTAETEVSDEIREVSEAGGENGSAEETAQPGESSESSENTETGDSTGGETTGADDGTQEVPVETNEAGTTEETAGTEEAGTTEETVEEEETVTETVEETTAVDETVEEETEEETTVVDDVSNDGADGEVAEQVTITLHINIGYNKDEQWGSSVCVHRWGDGVHDPEESEYKWPGDSVTDKDENGYYLYNIAVDQGKDFSYIINNGNNGKQTINMTIPASELTEKEKYDLWVAVDAKNRKNEDEQYKYVPSTYTEIYPKINGKEVTFVYKNSSATSVKFAGTMTDWGNGAEEMSEKDGTFTITKKLAHGEYEYKFIVDGNAWIPDPANPALAEKKDTDHNSFLYVPEDTTYTYTVHYYNMAQPDLEIGTPDIHVWELDCPSQEAKQYKFTEKKEFDGIPWLTATFSMACRNIGIIGRPGGVWNEDKDIDQSYRLSDTTKTELWYVHGLGVYTTRPNLESLEKVTASLQLSEMNYTQNNVLSLVLNDDKETKLALKEAYVDASALGISDHLNIDTELLEVSLSVTQGTTPGEYELPITVVDSNGKAVKSSVTVNVVEKPESETDFDWDEAVIYFMVTDRFFDGNSSNNNANGEETYKANAEGKERDGLYHGGDFAGVTKKLDYLKDLGVNTIWITPIVENVKGVKVGDGTGEVPYYAGYHGYWASDFTKLNPALGTPEEFKTLIDTAHAKGMKIMVDVVVNHAGYGMEDSATFSGMLRDSVVSGNYELGDGQAGLPDFLTELPEVRDKIIQWQVNWAKQGVDYFRVDTVKHVDSTTWMAFKNELTKANPKFKMIGEYYGAGYNSENGGTLGSGQMDSLLDFNFNDWATTFVTGDIASVEQNLANRNNELDNTYLTGQFLSSHDEIGFKENLTEKKSFSEADAEAAALVAATLQITAKGQPVIYYGEEIGLTGDNDYPYQTNRYDFDWSQTETGSDNKTLAHYKTLLNIRKQYSDIFAKGSRAVIAQSDTEKYDIIARTYNGETVYVGMNVGNTAKTITIPVDSNGITQYKDLYQELSNAAGDESTEGLAENGRFDVTNGQITITIPAAADGGTVILAASAFKESLGKPDIMIAKSVDEKGKTTALPLQLTFVATDGKKSLVDVNYEIVSTADEDLTGVTLDAENKKITVTNQFTGNELTLKATATVGTSEVSVTFTSKVVEDKNEITLRLHYTRPDKNYTDWNIWAWGDGNSDRRVDFDAEAGENGEKVATFIYKGREVSTLNYIIRKSTTANEWADKDRQDDQFVDLSDILSGTVDLWVDSGKVGRRELGEDVLLGAKVKSATYRSSNNTIKVVTGLPIVGNSDNAFTLKAANGTPIPITKVTVSKNEYTLTLGEDLSTMEAMAKEYTLVFDGYDYRVAMPSVYSSEDFENQFTYEGDDLGATWTKDKTTFKVWAPTADKVEVYLYDNGEVKKKEVDGEIIPVKEDPKKILPMTKGEKGVWSVEEAGDLNGTYYTYCVFVNGETTEACDPYARTTGVNGDRAMVIDLASTNPAGWENDISPNQGMSYTDSVIYELHVRDFSIDESSGISEDNKGKFLGLTETGTKNATGQSTGLDYLKDLGVTHIHLLPSYDYATVDETKLDTPQYNWGYDPKNYNVPEGSYSTDPYNGDVRVKEMKQMIKTLHDNNINVIMDVVYNHVYNADAFCFNQLVPKYFSRTNADGSYSSGSGCGNDTASERSMVKKYIVDSVNYWADEYHIDGFRFDLVGLLDTETINEVVNTVHKKHPDAVFYGEGWTMNTAVSKDGYTMATQANSAKTPEFAFFSDTIRDAIKGDNFNAANTGFVSGAIGKEAAIAACFIAAPDWCKSPTQTVNYASCHDNYTLWDKLSESRKDASQAELIKMNNLSAAIYMMSEGIPLIHAGEEILRTKENEDGSKEHNSYNSPDSVNSIKWSDLNKEEYRAVRDYYKGLIEFRKNHAALRLTSAADVSANVKCHLAAGNVTMFTINGKESIPTEVSDGMIVIFNANTSEKVINLGDYNIAEGTWNVCINDQKAGIETLSSITDGKVTVAPISAMVLVKGETKDTDTVYDKNELTKRKLQALKDLIAEYENLDSAKYTPESFAVFAAALEEAKKTASTADVTVDAIDLARTNLQAAIDNLEPLEGAIIDKTALEALVKECQKITGQGNYTDESWEVFQTALKEAEKVLADQNASQADIDKAEETLNTAYKGLAQYKEGLWTKWADTSGLTLGEDGMFHITYTGKVIKPAILVYDGRNLLKEKTDYTLTYKNNTNAGEAVVTVKGKGNYSEALEEKFVIDRVNLADLDIADLYTAVAANNTKQIALKPVVKYNGKSLKLKTDYTVTYENPETDGKTPGIYKVKIQSGTDLNKNKNYTGETEIQMTLVDKATVTLMSKVSIKKIPAQQYAWDDTLKHGKVQTPELTVKAGGKLLTPKDAADPEKEWDYEIIYDTKHTEAGETATVTIKGNGKTYVGQKTATFKITGTALKANKVSLKDVPKQGYVYTGTPIRPEVSVDIEQKDYEQYSVDYQKNTDVGTATVLITGKNGYTGTVKKTFKITPYDISKNEGSSFVFGENNVITAKVPYTKGGSKLTDAQVNASFSYTDTDGTNKVYSLIQGTDYTLSYKNNGKVSTEAAKASVTIKGKGNFKGSITKVPFEIEPKDISTLEEYASAGDIVVKNAAKYNNVMPVIKDVSGKALKNKTDYKVDKETAYTYADGTPITETPAVNSVIKVTAKAAGANYIGEVSATFRVIADDKNISSLKIAIAEQQYTGDAVTLEGKNAFTFKQKVKGKWEDVTLVEGTDYEIVKGSYVKNIKKGTAKVTIHGLGEYGGTKTLTFKIKAKPMKNPQTQETK